jgi:hypothetical protein
MALAGSPERQCYQYMVNAWVELCATPTRPNDGGFLRTPSTSAAIWCFVPPG